MTPCMYVLRLVSTPLLTVLSSPYPQLPVLLLLQSLRCPHRSSQRALSCASPETTLEGMFSSFCLSTSPSYRPHQPDSSSSTCDNFYCRVPFSLFERKHVRRSLTLPNPSLIPHTALSQMWRRLLRSLHISHNSPSRRLQPLNPPTAQKYAHLRVRVSHLPYRCFSGL